MMAFYKLAYYWSLLTACMCSVEKNVSTILITPTFSTNHYTIGLNPSNNIVYTTSVHKTFSRTATQSKTKDFVAKISSSHVIRNVTATQSKANDFVTSTKISSSHVTRNITATLSKNITHLNLTSIIYTMTSQVVNATRTNKDDGTLLRDIAILLGTVTGVLFMVVAFETFICIKQCLFGKNDMDPFMM